MSRPDVVVVGAGVIGCATAFALARAGATVVVLERDDLGRHASRAAAGMLAPLTESDGEGPASALGLRSLALFPEFVAELRELSGIDPLLREIGILRAARTDEVAALRLRAKQLALHDCLWLEPEEARKREPLLAPDLAGALWSPREAHVNSLLLTRACARGRTAGRAPRGRLRGAGLAACRRPRDRRAHDGR